LLTILFVPTNNWGFSQSTSMLGGFKFMENIPNVTYNQMWVSHHVQDFGKMVIPIQPIKYSVILCFEWWWMSIKFCSIGVFSNFHNSPHQIYQSYEWYMLIHYLENCWQINMALPWEFTKLII
jgi:hypothetical protein